MLFNYFKKKKYKKLIAYANDLYENNKIKEAIDVYEEAFDIIINVNDYIKLACIYIDLKEYDKGIKIFNNILSYYEDDKNNIQGICDVYFGLGVAHDCLRQIDKAVYYYEEAIKNGILACECFYFLACIYDDYNLDKDNEYTIKALTYYKKAIELNNEYLFAYVNLGTLYSRCGDNDNALKCFLKAKSLDKDNDTNIDYNLGVAYSTLNDFDNALHYYMEELKTENPYEATYYNLGVLYKDNKNYEKAKYYYLKAIEKNKEEYNAWYNLACLYALMDDFENALDCFTYIKYKKKNLIEAILEDPELVSFRSSEYMKKLEEL